MILGIVIFTVVKQGASALSVSFLTQNPAVGLGAAGGGIANAIIGSVLIVAVATAMALPIGALIALYLTEFSTPRTAAPIRLTLDLLNGTPTIVIGVFVFGFLVVAHGQSGFAASIALAVIMLPLIARTTQEMLLLVPRELRDAAHALGVRRWRAIVGIVLPSALGGILTGAVLAIARAFGETAPLLLCDSIFGNQTSLNVFGTAVPNIPIDIFHYSESGFPARQSARVGCCARPDRHDPRGQPRRTREYSGDSAERCLHDDRQRHDWEKRGDERQRARDHRQNAHRQLYGSRPKQAQ